MTWIPDVNSGSCHFEIAEGQWESCGCPPGSPCEAYERKVISTGSDGRPALNDKPLKTGAIA